MTSPLWFVWESVVLAILYPAMTPCCPWVPTFEKIGLLEKWKPSFHICICIFKFITYSSYASQHSVSHQQKIRYALFCLTCLVHVQIHESNMADYQLIMHGVKCGSHKGWSQLIKSTITSESFCACIMDVWNFSLVFLY